MSETPKSICVFAGSSFGRKPIYREAAEALGQAIGSRGLTLVYGGARIGLMGTVANAVLAEDGEVHGVLPRHLADLEIAHHGLTQLELVDSMHARKARMNELADAFIALPGGIGTLEEAIEIWTWGQLQLHAKPLGLLNVDGFYDQLSGFLDHVTAERFLTEAYRATLISQPSPETLIDLILTAEIPVGQKWIDDLQD